MSFCFIACPCNACYIAYLMRLLNVKNNSQHAPREDYLIHGDCTEAFMRFYCTNTYLWKLYVRHLKDFLKYKLHVLKSSIYYQILLRDLLEELA